MTHTITVLTSSAGMRHHLPDMFLDESSFEGRERFLASPLPETAEEAVVEAEWFSHLMMQADSIRPDGLSTFASEHWGVRWESAHRFGKLERVSGTWSEALEDAINAHSRLEYCFEDLVWMSDNRDLWAQHQELRPALIAAGIDPAARLTLSHLAQSGCLATGEWPGLFVLDFVSPHHFDNGDWLDFRCDLDDRNLILFEASAERCT